MMDTGVNRQVTKPASVMSSEICGEDESRSNVVSVMSKTNELGKKVAPGFFNAPQDASCNVSQASIHVIQPRPRNGSLKKI